MSNRILSENREYNGGPTGFQNRKDNYDVDIPAGQQYKEAVLTPDGSGLDFGARIESQPTAGDTGSGQIVISSWCSALGKVSYTLEAFSDISRTANPPGPTTPPRPPDPNQTASPAQGSGGGNCCCEVASAAIVQVGAIAKMSSDAAASAMVQTTAMTRMTSDLLLAQTMQTQAMSKASSELLRRILSQSATIQQLLIKKMRERG